MRFRVILRNSTYIVVSGVTSISFQNVDCYSVHDSTLVETKTVVSFSNGLATVAHVFLDEISRIEPVNHND